MTVAGQPLGDGSTTAEKLRTLLALGGELDDLDFKEHLDLSQHKDKVELVKDFAAMQSIPTGGYVVVGADDQGLVSNRFGQLNVADFDPSNLHRIAHPYLPTIQVRASTHDIDGVTVAIIYIGPPEPPGVAIIVKDGQYPDGKKTKPVLTPGDVFVRRGMQSVRWLPSDLPGVLKLWEDSIREDERRRATVYAEQLLQGERERAIAQGPLGSLTWRLASEEFDAAFLEAMRAGDGMALRRLILTFGADASALANGDDPQELDLLLDRLLAALAVTAASWARLLYVAPREDGVPERQIGGRVVALARQLVERIRALRPDTQVSPFELNSAPDANDKVLDSLIQFDVMWCVIAVAHSGWKHHQYPSFASFYAHRAEPAFALLVDDPGTRGLVLADDAGDAESLKSSLRTVADTARHVSLSEGRSPWWPESEKLTEYLAAELEQ